MKHVLIFCNYFEGRTGNLEKCLESFYKCKQNNDVVVGFIDNGSTDSSYEIVKKYIDNKFIDYYIFNAKNVGKAKAQNSLVKYILINNKFDENTLVYLIDSDIQILDDSLIYKMDGVFSNNKDISLISCEIVNENGKNFKDIFNDFDNTEKINDLDFYIVKQQNGIQGSLYIIPISIFLKVGMYNEDLGKDRMSAIYGGDDAVLELKIFKTFPDMKNLICKSIKYFHPKTVDEEYNNWKIEQNSLMCKNGFGNNILDNKGFYDEQ